MIELTQEQLAVVEGIKDFLNPSNPAECYTLAGVGGGGKTSSLKEAIKGRIGIVGATISHSARFVLQKSLGPSVPCFTVAQLLGLKQTITEDGEIRFTPSYSKQVLPIHTADIIIIDECSMIDPNTYYRILNMKKPNSKVLWVGDPYQLCPIEGVDDSLSFDTINGELKTPIRYTGHLAVLGQRIRDEIEKLNAGDTASKFLLNDWMMSELDKDCRTSRVDEDGSGFVFLNNIDKVIDICINTFKKSDDPDELRLIAYRNKSIEKINSVIRTQLYCDGDEELEKTIPQYVNEELIICDGGYTINNNPVIHNNQTFKIIDTCPVVGPYDIPSLELKLSPEVALPPGGKIITIDWEKGRHKYFERINKLRADAKNKIIPWSNYYDFKNQWAWFNYAYSLSSHKS